MDIKKDDLGTSLKNFSFHSSSSVIFFHAGCDFLHPEELAPHAKNDECGFYHLQSWSRILHNWHFLEIFVQINKKKDLAKAA